MVCEWGDDRTELVVLSAMRSVKPNAFLLGARANLAKHCYIAIKVE